MQPEFDGFPFDANFKIAWQQETNGDGLVHPGTFVQVKLMVKDGRRFSEPPTLVSGFWNFAPESS